MSADVPAAPRLSEEVLRQQYSIQVDMLKFYLELVLKVNAYYYALTGAVSSYVLANLGSITKKALWLPVLLGVGILVVEIFGALRSKISALEMQQAAQALNLIAWPGRKVLTAAMWVSAAVRLIVIVGLLWFILFGPGGNISGWFRRKPTTPAYSRIEVPAVVEESPTPIFRAEEFIPVTAPPPTRTPQKKK